MKLRVFRAITLALVLVFCLDPASAYSEVVISTPRGPVTVFVPDSYSSGTPAPLIFLLHGYGSDGQSVESKFQLLPLVDTHGFIYVHPEGTIDSSGLRFWNATNACCDYFGSGVDDAAYLRGLISTIEGNWSIDPSRISIVGYSNGGFMAYRMACDFPDKIASIASLAGATWVEAALCAPPATVHVLQIHGTADNNVPYTGGSFQGVPFPGAVETAIQWAGFDLCEVLGVPVSKSFDLDDTIAGNETTVEVFNGCAAGGSAELWTMNGSNHFPALSATFPDILVGHLLAHPKNEAPVSYCTAGTSTSGCQAVISASGVPSASLVSGFELGASGVEGGKDGLFFFGTSGRQASPWGSGTSYQCVIPPVRRGGLLVGTGTPGTCDGSVSLDPNARWTALPQQNPGSGAVVQAQLWYRDPLSTSNQTTSLSDAVEFVVGP